MSELTNTERQQLDEVGYILRENFMPAGWLEELRQRTAELFAAEGEQAGGEFKQEPGARRLANLVDKGEVFRRLVTFPWLVESVRHIMGPAVKLSSLNARTALPGTGIAQPLHADMGAIADERGYWVVNSVWLLDDFTAENGALRVVPGSHRWGLLPQQELADPLADHPQQQLVLAPAGSVLVMNAHLWHAGTANRAERERRAVHVFYCRGDRPQQQYQRGLVRAEIQETLSPELRAMLALDDPQNDFLSTQEVTRSGFLK